MTFPHVRKHSFILGAAVARKASGKQLSESRIRFKRADLHLSILGKGFDVTLLESSHVFDVLAFLTQFAT